jgi:hypothetical protein
MCSSRSGGTQVQQRSGLLLEQAGCQDVTQPLKKTRLDAALAPNLSRLPDAILMIEGYSQAGAVADRHIVSRTRAALVRDYLVARFQLDPGAVGLMPLGSEAVESPQGITWSGVALAVFLSQ